MQTSCSVCRLNVNRCLHCRRHSPPFLSLAFSISPFCVILGVHWRLTWSSIGSEPHLQAFSRYSASNISGSRPWPFGVTWHHRSRDDSIPYNAVSYWSSIGTEPLYLSIFEIFGSKVPFQCKSSLRMRDITWPVCTLYVKFGYIFEFLTPHIAYSLWHFYWTPMKNKGCLLVRPPMLNAKSSGFLSPKNWQILTF